MNFFWWAVIIVAALGLLYLAFGNTPVRTGNNGDNPLSRLDRDESDRRRRESGLVNVDLGRDLWPDRTGTETASGLGAEVQADTETGGAISSAGVMPANAGASPAPAVTNAYGRVAANRLTPDVVEAGDAQDAGISQDADDDAEATRIPDSTDLIGAAATNIAINPDMGMGAVGIDTFGVSAMAAAEPTAADATDTAGSVERYAAMMYEQSGPAESADEWPHEAFGRDIDDEMETQSSSDSAPLI